MGHRGASRAVIEFRTAAVLAACLAVCLAAASCAPADNTPRVTITNPTDLVQHGRAFRFVSDKSPREVADCLVARRNFLQKLSPTIINQKEAIKQFVGPGKTAGSYYYAYRADFDRCRGGSCTTAARGYHVYADIRPRGTGSSISMYMQGPEKLNRTLTRGYTKGCAQRVASPAT